MFGRRNGKAKAFNPIVSAFLAVLTSGALLVVFMRLTGAPVKAEWYDEGWAYRVPLRFTNSGSAVTNQYVTFTLATNAAPLNKLRSDCADARFTDAGGKLLDYYQTNSCQAVSTTYHVLMPSIPAGGNLVHFYYGNPNASAGTRNSDFTETAQEQHSQ